MMPVRLRHDGLDLQLVPVRAPDRQGESEDHDGGHRAAVEAHPVELPVVGGGELLADPELVRQGEADAEVGVEVDQVPRLVPQLAPGRPDRQADDRDQQHGPGGRQQHAGVVRDEVPGLVEQARVDLLGVPQDDQRDVHHHQPERGETDQPVPAGQHILAVGPLDPRDPGHQQHLQDQQVRRDQAGQPPDRDGDATGGAHFLDAAVGEPQRHHDDHAGQRQRAGQVAPPLARAAWRNAHAG